MSTRHLNQKQLAERWGVSPKTLERWRWLGQGPKFLKLGGRILYRLEDIETYRGAAAPPGDRFCRRGVADAGCPAAADVARAAGTNWPLCSRVAQSRLNILSQTIRTLP